MKNISLDNPLLLLVGVPIIIILVVSYFISVSKDNKHFGWKLSLALHIGIAVLLSFALAGVTSRTVLTRTDVYVLADVSYSSERNLDEIDGYVQKIKESLPDNSRLGVICFGKNYVVTTQLGRELKSVKDSGVDTSSTNIAVALEAVEGRFSEDSLKRVILITDGNDTSSKDNSGIASAVARLTEQGVRVDAIFLDNTLKENETELQLSSCDFNPSTYMGHSDTVRLLIEASGSSNVIVELYRRPDGSLEYEKIESTAIKAEAGLNSVTLPLYTDEEGIYSYKAVIVGERDISDKNNELIFTQSVAGQPRILLIAGSQAELNAASLIYGDRAEIDGYTVTHRGSDVPFRLEELASYDEIVLSGVDIDDINNSNAFVDSLDTVISQYGKSLLTMGDLKLQNNDKEIYGKLTELLPVTYGNSNRDGKLYTIVLDVSHSMFMASKYAIAKESAIKLISLLNEEDYICLVTFSGQVKVRTPAKVKECRSELEDYIKSLDTSHGTDIGMGLEEAFKVIESLKLRENQVMVISDGLSFDSRVNAVEEAKKLSDSGTAVSAIDVYIPMDGTTGTALMKRITETGEGGKYYQLSSENEIDGLVFGQVANEITDAVIYKSSTVNINRYRDEALKGISSLPSVSVYIQSMAKYDATVPLTLNYEKLSGYTVQVPLYAYRSHGNGRVSSFTSSLTGSWTSGWSAEDKAALLGNILTANTPPAKVDYPFTLTVEPGSLDTYVEIVPSILNPDAKVNVRLVPPSGLATNRALSFDSRKYYYTFPTSEVGSYKLEVTYAYDDKSFTARSYFDISYLPEYNAFAAFDKTAIYQFMKGNGTISEDGIPSLENNEGDIATYKVSYTVPLLIAAAVLFLIDIATRTIKLKDRRTRQKEREARMKIRKESGK